MDTVRIACGHSRAICDEVGERLRQHFDRTATAPSRKILELLRELERQEFEIPSVIPSLEDMEPLAFKLAEA